MKDFLIKLIARKKAEIKDCEKRSDASDSIEEVRAIGETMKKLRDEINEAEKQLAEVEANEPDDGGSDDGNGGDGDDAGNGENRSAIPARPVGGFNPIATYGGNANGNGAVNVRSYDNDPTCTMEYRSAFMDFVMNGTRAAILSEARADANTTTTDVGTVIPTILIDKIVEKAEATGMIYPLVTKTNYAAGVEIPVSTLKPVASWVAEGASSSRQKKTTTKISFVHHKLRCEVSVSMEVGTMAISAFENKLVENVVEAMVKAKEQAIISGSGTGQPSGILNETPETGQSISVTAAAGLSYELLCNAEAALPQAYENNAVWCMTKGTFYKFQAITDEAGQPVARVNWGIGGKPERSLLGREVVLCGDYMDTYDPTSTGDKFAFMFDFSDYVMNSIYDMGIQRKQDWDTEDLLTKAVTACDGKVADKRSLVVLVSA